MNYSYAKLKLKQYKEIYWDLKQYYDNPQTCIREIEINYFIADIKLNKLDDKKIKNKILNNKVETPYQIGGGVSYIVMDKLMDILAK